MRSILITAIALALAAPATAAGLQDDYNAAQTALDAGKYPEARDGFRALLARMKPGDNGRIVNIFRARLGKALISNNDPEAAEPLLAQALASFTGTTPEAVQDRAVAGFDRGIGLESAGRLDSAAAAYRTVMAEKAFAPDSSDDIALRTALARVSIWSAPDAARALIDGLLALPDSAFAKTTDARALLLTLRGRVELNNNHALESLRWFKLAASAAGGATTRKINIADVRIRGDLALAYARKGDKVEQQKAVAFSGAGSLVTEGLTSAAAMPLPDCAPATNLAPDAVAVVEFTIGDDGAAASITPVYASRGSGTLAPGALDDGPESVFSQAVRHWFWASGALAKLDPFWRRAIRVELRCFTSGSTADPSEDVFRTETSAWLDQLGVREMPDLGDDEVRAWPIIRAELARREQQYGAESVQLIPVLVALSSSRAAPKPEREAAETRWHSIFQRANPPPALRIDSELTDISWQASQQKTNAAIRQYKAKALAALLAATEAAGNGETRAAMLIRLRLGETLEDLKDPAGAWDQFNYIVATPPTLLPADDAIRTAALLHVANLAAAARDTVTAANALAATGLSAEQCSLIDIRPQAVNATVTERAFPQDAISWGTGGFARVGFDITADGNTTNVRTIIASPPFVFGPGTESAVKHFAYKPVFRPGNTLGCTGSTITPHFRVIGR